MSDPIQGVVAANQMAPISQPSPTDSKPGAAGPSFQEVFEAGATGQPEAAEAVQPSAPVEKSEAVAQLDAFVDGVCQDEKRMNQLMGKLERGQTLTQGQLLELQGVMYGYAQKVDIASKVVDKSTSGLKQVMNTQV